jgi:hypothetical protein
MWDLGHGNNAQYLRDRSACSELSFAVAHMAEATCSRGSYKLRHGKSTVTEVEYDFALLGSWYGIDIPSPIDLGIDTPAIQHPALSYFIKIHMPPMAPLLNRPNPNSPINAPARIDRK